MRIEILAIENSETKRMAVAMPSFSQYYVITFHFTLYFFRDLSFPHHQETNPTTSLQHPLALPKHNQKANGRY